MLLRESAIPITEEVKGACEILGLDPLCVANDGKLLAIVSPEDADPVLDATKFHSPGKEAAIIGEVSADHPGFVMMKTRVGGTRVADMLSGEHYRAFAEVNSVAASLCEARVTYVQQRTGRS